jgi:hypothetical protein
MSRTSTIVLLTVIPLLLSGFFNRFGNKNWILYFPLAGIVLLIFYVGHIGIRSLEKNATNPPKPTVDMPPNRPWLAVDVVAAGDISFIANGSATIPLKITVNNSGRMPANDARLDAEMICPPFGNESLTGSMKRRDEICNEAIRHRFGASSFGTIFRDKSSELIISFVLDPQTMAAQVQSLHRPLEGDASKRDIWSNSPKFIWPSLVGCVTYTFAASGHEFIGQTGFVYEINRIPMGENVSESEVVIRKPEINGDFAR